MKKKSTSKFKAINKEAIVGTRVKISSFNPVPTEKNNSKKSSSVKMAASIRPAKSKPRKCSGCSRTRKRG